MKRIILLIGVVILATLLLIQPVSVSAQTYPEPKGYVNDFANIIPDAVEQRLGQKLSDYTAKTTNEIAVVTVQSLGGLTVEDYTIKLAEKWKVGKKDKDNGVILLVAPNERKVRIEVGYGLEGTLTDARAKMIIERAIIPEFKTGNFAAGIEKGVGQIIDVITPPVKAVPTDAPKQEEKSGNAGWIVLFVFLGIGLTVGLIIFIVWLVKACKRWSAEKKRREAVREETSKLLASLSTELAEVLDAAKKLKELTLYPKRLLQESNGIAGHAALMGRKADLLCGEAEDKLKKHPDDALAKAKEAQSSLQDMNQYLSRFIGKLEVFDKAREENKFYQTQAELALVGARTYLVSLEAKGYKVSLIKELEELTEELTAAKKNLLQKDEVPDYELIVDYARNALWKAAEVKPRWEGVLKIQGENETAIQNLRKWHASLPELQKRSETDLDKLKKEVPLEVWQPVADSIETLKTIPGKISALIEEAAHLNGMTAQDFTGASRLVKDIWITEQNAENTFKEPARTLREWTGALEGSGFLNAGALSSLRDAEKAIKDPDAGDVGKKKLEQARRELAEADNLKKSVSPNWILIARVLAAAIGLANGAKRDAESRAENARETRRRKKEEEEEEERRRKRRREEEERRRRDEEDSHRSNSSWSSSSSHSSGGGSSFGGGSFGGGGASGGW